MGETGDAPSVFGLLSDRTRVDILCAMAEAQLDVGGSGSGPVELGFSEIYDRVEVDNTSKLSYHLGELTGTFLLKRGDGYAFNHAGEQIVRFILAENYGEPERIGSVDLDGRCLFCGDSELQAGLHDQFFFVRCQACDRPVLGQPVTPAQTRREDAEAVVRSVRRRQVVFGRQFQQQQCPECGGLLPSDARRIRTISMGDTEMFVVTDECRECLRQYNGPLRYRVAYHPASIAFHWDRGTDVTSQGAWEFHEHVLEDRWRSSKVGEDPAEYEVVYDYDTESLRFRLDKHARVTETERARRHEGFSDR